jgi:hypothetical protein
MQLSHLFVADLLWIFLIALVIETAAPSDTAARRDTLPAEAVHEV